MVDSQDNKKDNKQTVSSKFTRFIISCQLFFTRLSRKFFDSYKDFRDMSWRTKETGVDPFSTGHMQEKKINSIDTSTSIWRNSAGLECDTLASNPVAQITPNKPNKPNKPNADLMDSLRI